jgi:uncharacterized protein YukE
MNTETRLFELVSTMKELAEAAREETAALRALEIEKFRQLSIRKLALATLYKEQMQQLRERPHEIEALPVEWRGSLAKDFERFQKTINENMIALDATHQITKRVVGLIVDTMRSKAKEPPRYGEDARRAASIAGPLSMGLLRQL